LPALLHAYAFHDAELLHAKLLYADELCAGFPAVNVSAAVLSAFFPTCVPADNEL
jgi:hypothetical protein